MRVSFVCVFLAARVVGAVYVDCSSADAVLRVSTCQTKYNVTDASSSATACVYFTNMAACIPAACCVIEYYHYMEQSRKVLEDLGLTDCNNVCGGPGEHTDVSCTSSTVDTSVRACGETVPMDDAVASSACPHYMKLASCIPAECCAVPYFVDWLKSNKAILNGIGQTACSPVCSPMLSVSARVTTGGRWFLWLALVLVIFI